jgi:hypothetical protein
MESARKLHALSFRHVERLICPQAPLTGGAKRARAAY